MEYCGIETIVYVPKNIIDTKRVKNLYVIKIFFCFCVVVVFVVLLLFYC